MKTATAKSRFAAGAARASPEIFQVAATLPIGHLPEGGGRPLASLFFGATLAPFLIAPLLSSKSINSYRLLHAT